MADEENIEMRDLDRVPGEAPEEGAKGETSFGDNPLLEQRPDPNRSIQVIDTSVPNITRDVGTFKRAYTQDKKDVLQKNLGIALNKTDSPSSKTLFGNIELTMSKDHKKVNRVKSKGTKIVVYKDGQIDYSSARNSLFDKEDGRQRNYPFYIRGHYTIVTNESALLCKQLGARDNILFC